MNYMWQEERSQPYYRFQSDDRSIANKMKRREKFKLVASGVNCNLWVFVATFSRPDIARKSFKALTGSKPVFNTKEEIFQSPNNYSRAENYAA